MRLPEPASSTSRDLARTLGVTITFADVLTRRGHADDDATKRFLSPKLAHLTPPEAMLDRDVMAERLSLAIDRGERITVFGDYDCDGITAAAVLTEALRAMGGTVTTLLASRFSGGYGLSEEALVRVIETAPNVLVTCDCGSSDHARIAAAQAKGIDVLVIDHHLVPPEPLPAMAFLNPHRPECGFPYKGLASCGLALSVAAAIRAKRKATLDLRQYLDLVAIGTIADVAPLDGDNRALVRAGLEIIRELRRPGLAALAAHAKLDTSAPLSAEDVSHKLAPRLNAPGRLASPDLALALLLAKNVTEARSHAAACEQANVERRALQDRMIEEAMADAKAQGDAPALVLGREGWHAGVVGIVAGRLASTLGKPTLVAAFENGVATASVRSARGVSLIAALTKCDGLLGRFGGHAKAAGATFEAARLVELQAAFAAACDSLAETTEDTGGAGDVRLDEGDDPARVAAELASLEPCGEGNRAPVLVLEGARVRSAREVKGGHLKLELELGGKVIGGFGASLGHLAKGLAERVHVAGVLRRDAWRGGSAVEVSVRAIESA